MKLSDYLAARELSQQQFAEKLGVSQGMVHQWIAGRTPVAAQKAVLIEQTTGGEVTRKDLHPTDWHLIWPELIESPATA
jgi:DNA-binding transcriptional regulator YdaS (Cro superfamily)